MNSTIDKTASTIASGFITIGIVVLILGIIAILFGKQFGRKNKRQEKAITHIIWLIGLVLITFFIPRFFSQS